MALGPFSFRRIQEEAVTVVTRSRSAVWVNLQASGSAELEDGQPFHRLVMRAMRYCRDLLDGSSPSMASRAISYCRSSKMG